MTDKIIKYSTIAHAYTEITDTPIHHYTDTTMAKT